MTTENKPQNQEAQLAALMDLPYPATAPEALLREEERQALENKQQLLAPSNPPPATPPGGTVTVREARPRTPMTAGAAIAAIVPTTIEDAWRLSESIVLAKMVPAGYDKGTEKEQTAKVMIGIMKGLEVGFAPISALNTIMIVNNRTTIWGDGAMALVQSSGKMEYIRETHTGTEFSDDWTAICEVKRVGQEPVQRQFSFGNAKKAGLINKGPWLQYPGRMLQMRARAWALRDVFADALNGLAIHEEVKDYSDVKNNGTDISSLDDEPQTTEKTDEQANDQPRRIEGSSSSETVGATRD